MFPWFYNNKKVYHTGKDSLFDYQFTHLFYQDFKILVDCRKNYGLFINLVQQKIDFLQKWIFGRKSI